VREKCGSAMLGMAIRKWSVRLTCNMGARVRIVIAAGAPHNLDSKQAPMGAVAPGIGRTPVGFRRDPLRRERASHYPWNEIKK
jgi:hypothetical protein